MIASDQGRVHAAGDLPSTSFDGQAEVRLQNLITVKLRTESGDRFAKGRQDLDQTFLQGPAVWVRERGPGQCSTFSFILYQYSVLPCRLTSRAKVAARAPLHHTFLADFAQAEQSRAHKNRVTDCPASGHPPPEKQIKYDPTQSLLPFLPFRLSFSLQLAYPIPVCNYSSSL